MKFGFVLPTYLPSDERKAWAERSFTSLVKTRFSVPSTNTLLFGMPASVPYVPPLYVVAKARPAYRLAVEKLPTATVFQQPDNLPGGVDPALLWIIEKMLEEKPEVTHIVELADDMVYHPHWVTALEALVFSHSKARAWSVYRSAYERHYRTISQSSLGDHLVTGLAGNGTCWTREEHEAWGVKSTQGPTWPNPEAGDTLDLHHMYYRPGERWATDVSYMDHIGVRGTHSTPDIPDHAVNFVGED